MAKFLAAVLLLAISALTYAKSNAELEKEQLRTEISELVSKKDYRAILLRAEAESATRARFSDGMWRVSLLYADFWDELQSQLRGDRAWDEAETLTSSLTKGNANAWLLHEQVLSARAWSIRGPGYASEVSAEAFGGFRRVLRRARQVLDDRKSTLASNAAWYSMRLTLAIELGEGEAAGRALFEEGVGRHPTYHAIYFSRMRQLSPNWGGSKLRMLDFLDAVAAMRGQTLSEGMYARLVWFADGTGFPLIHEPRLNGKAMTEHSDQLLTLFPDQWNAQKLFFMACERSDKEHTIRTMSVVRDPPLPAIWGRNIPLYQMCKDWASGRVPAFLMRDRDGDKVKEYLIR